MVELAVATALGLVQIIIPLLSKLNLHVDAELKEDIESMRSWLRFIRAHMEDNYGLQKDQRQRFVIESVGKIAYDIEDVVDEFILHSPPYTFHHYKLSRTIHTMAHNVCHRFPQRGISEKIARIKKDIKKIKEQNSFSVNNRSSSSDSSRPSSSTSSRATVSPLLLDDEMVGYENPKTEITKKLLDIREKRLVRIGVDGPPGSGKTTLVKNIFWKRGIQAQFDCHAWISVSQNPDVEKIIQNLLLQLSSSRKEAYPVNNGTDLRTRLSTYLTGKKFLIVVDDIWRQEDWIYLKDSLPDSFRGSRVLVTTRLSNLSSISSFSHVISLQGLQSLDAWKLFCRRAFPSKRECPSELKDISMSIKERCEGLPLAIVAVAGALAQKPQNPYEWERFHNNIGNEIRGSSDLSPITSSLLSSYTDLSSSLKCCFLYMSIFHEDHSVKRGRLIRLWVAERFAVGTEDQTAEEVAEDYLNQLIQRNLIHVSNRDFDGRPRNCRVLNIVLKFIIQKSKDENFASIFPKETTSQTQLTGPDQMKIIRRLSVHDHCKHLPQDGNLASVRSLFLLRLLEVNPELERNLRRLKLIKVVDVQGAPLREFPKEMSRFILMRYLSFRDTKIKSIPGSIEKLFYLETLDLKQTQVTELPQEISNLHNLRHLFAYIKNVINYVNFDSVQGVKLQEGIGKLANLQNLSLVKIGENGRILRDLKELTQLRKLGVTGLRKEHGKDLCAAVEAMRSIKTLHITSFAKDELIEVGEMRNPPRTLQRLYLKGRLEKIPTWISQLDYVVTIGLMWSRLRDSPLEILKSLPKLTELQMVDCFTGDILTFEALCFKKLEILLIEDLSNVNTIVIEEGAMPEMKKISLRKCHALTMVLGVNKLAKVEELTLHDMGKNW